MSLLAMPWLVVNLGTEMIYILDQRLKAQNIPPEKSSKVRSAPSPGASLRAEVQQTAARIGQAFQSGPCLED